MHGDALSVNKQGHILHFDVSFDLLRFSLCFSFFFRYSAIKVAHTGQTIEQSVENVVSAVSEIAKIVPRGWNNIQSLNLKTSDSISLPIYTSLPEKSLAIDDTPPPKKKRKMDT